jgi:hypothetical protein
VRRFRHSLLSKIYSISSRGTDSHQNAHSAFVMVCGHRNSSEMTAESAAIDSESTLRVNWLFYAMWAGNAPKR